MTTTTSSSTTSEPSRIRIPTTPRQQGGGSIHNGAAAAAEAPPATTTTPSQRASTAASASSSTSGSTRRRRSNSFRQYDVSGTMDRLRSTMVGGEFHTNPVADDNDNLRIPSPPSPSRRRHQVPRHQAPLENELLPSISSSGTLDTSSSDRDRHRHSRHSSPPPLKWSQRLQNAAGQVPAIALIGMFHLMIGIPFGVSYFPIGWRRMDAADSMDAMDATTASSADAAGGEDEEAWIHGPFPLPGKEALGIRMFLLSTVIGQVAFTFASNFQNPIGLQMVENVPFCHELAAIVISAQGYGVEALSTLFVLFGLASIVVGLVFFWLGQLELGRIIYFFPTHVLVGCIGGIGVFIAKTGLEVTMDAMFSRESLVNSRDLLLPVVIFEVTLRVLEQVTKDASGKPRYSLLSPIYFCMITPIFYICLHVLHVPVSSAEEAGYFFPSLQDDDATADLADGASSSSLWSLFQDEHLWDMWRVIDFSVVSWKTVFVDCFPTLVALTLFSMIHVPINIPALAISTKTDNIEMNDELRAHGYSNIAAGMCGGMCNYLAYTQSVCYDRSGGTGKPSGVAVAIVTSMLFVVGPTIASYIPRCMAGTLLFHVGTDLFLEGVYDSYGKFDQLEYSGIWLIVLVMTAYGMDAAMIAGAIAAVSTYAVQSITYLNPIRGCMSAATLRSSHRVRAPMALAILNERRTHIFVMQLQGHMFFGNMAHLTERVKRLMVEEKPWIVIMDFSLVVSVDSSAARAIMKLRNNMQDKYHVNVCVFVTGSEAGFPCEFDLSEQLSSHRHRQVSSAKPDSDDCEIPDESTRLVSGTRYNFPDSYVCDHLDEALIYAENALIALENPDLLDDEHSTHEPLANEHTSLEDEKEIAYHYFCMICPEQVKMKDFEVLFGLFQREVYTCGDILWRQGSKSDCAKLLIRGTLVATLEHEAGTSETISCGNMIGELGLIQGDSRMSSVQCMSGMAVVYSLSTESFDELVKAHPHIARLFDLILIQYLANRVQHVSNRIFETRCLPI